MPNCSRNLYEVTVIRPVIIFLLVFMHSFTMFTGGDTWPLPVGIHHVEAYRQLTWFTYSFFLEMFVFISGYLFCYQTSKREIEWKSLIKKKAQRLLLPSIVFSTIYFLIFFLNSGQSWGSAILNILSGSGHMWFLPMLFWCFLLGFLLTKILIPEWVKLVVCCLLVAMSGVVGFLPFQIGKMCYYIFFFYLGVVVYNNKEYLSRKLSIGKILGLFVTYIVSYAILSSLKGEIVSLPATNIVMKIVKAALVRISTLCYSLAGLLSLYSIVQYWLNAHPNWKPSNMLLQLNSICFGIYIFHQFVLKYLYYKTPLSTYVGTYYLPWVGFGIALLSSIVMSVLLSKVRVGRLLLG